MAHGIRAALLLAFLAGSGGCGWQADRPVVYQIRTNDYVIEFDGQQKKATIGEGVFLIVRIPEDIRVVEGALRVGDREYGAVKLKDRISVVGGKVAINGQERKPSGS